MGKKLQYIFCLIVITLIHVVCVAQNTVGLISYDNPYEGYNLIYPHNQSSTYLLNNCGEIVHMWEDDPEFRPGNIAYISGEGNLIRAKRPIEVPNITFGAGGSGGIIEMVTWEGNVISSMTFMDTILRAHHDIDVMPNGNVLAIIWERKNLEELIQAGADTSLHTSLELWPDLIYELDLQGNQIVWEWHAWDHLVQDFDSTKTNFGKVENWPSKIDLNYNLGIQAGKSDWMHTNAIDYNPELDQILLSVPHFNEIWVIDHSTSIEEARSSEGGRYNQGGDLLYRYGNPTTYRQGTSIDQTLFFQHDARWILNESSRYYGMISYFNNRISNDSSQVEIINPNWDSQAEDYLIDNGRFLPMTQERIISNEDRSIYSSGLSSVQVLDNDNVLILSGRNGYAYEVDQINEVQWEYVIPLKGGIPVSQGELLASNDNLTFKMQRYNRDYIGFEGRSLDVQGTIELNPNLEACGITTSVHFDLDIYQSLKLNIYPNPTNDRIYIKDLKVKESVEIYDAEGRLVGHFIDNSANIEHLDSGNYFLLTSERRSAMFVKL